MNEVRELFTTMASRFQPSKCDAPITYYFSIGSEKWTVFVSPEGCEAKEGRVDSADCVIKADPKLFLKMVKEGKMPGPLDIARGKVKTNDVQLMSKMAQMFGIL